MKHIGITLILVTISLSLLVGCGADESIDELPTCPAKFVSAILPGGCLPANGTITVTFDNPPRDVKVSHGTVKIEGKTRLLIPLPIIFGLTLIWHSGTQALNYAWMDCNFL